ncbi:ribosomal protein S2 [Cystobasidium minutum MCA 4210]|uniref:mitochondrial 37S ribosomal protein uS2m n=1 Tax=Cystobasidium minutum MCA 4210 TaxID=1397322 RepID=UPI0034CFB371|eukprot:jgi/Rhomi1/168245/fgenesh1_kg.2_\
MASTSMLLRSVALNNKRSLLSGACNCLPSDASPNFKGKNRAAANLHTSRSTMQEQKLKVDSVSGRADVGVLDHASDSTLASSTSEAPVELETVTPDMSEESSMTKEQMEVFERKRRMALMSELEGVGSSQTRENTWQPHHSFTRAKTAQSVTLSHLLAATAHLGHSKALNHPMAFPHIYGTRHNVSIIDMRETLTALRRAAALVKATVENDGIVLFVGNKNLKDSERVLEANARKMGRNGYATSRWLPGTLTNATTLFSASKSMIQDSDANPTSFLPSLIVLFSPLTTPHTLREANATNIPTIALCDSNVDPRHFTYPIPCNDDSLRVVELISGVLAEAGKDGAKKRDAKQKQLQNSHNVLEREYQVQQKSMYNNRQRRLR